MDRQAGAGCDNDSININGNQVSFEVFLQFNDDSSNYGRGTITFLIIAEVDDSTLKMKSGVKPTKKIIKKSPIQKRAKKVMKKKK